MLKTNKMESEYFIKVILKRLEKVAVKLGRSEDLASSYYKELVDVKKLLEETIREKVKLNSELITYKEANQTLQNIIKDGKK